MTTVAQVKQITTEEYFATYPETTLHMELIDGEVITVPAPNDNHGYIVAYLSGLFFNAVIPNKLGEFRVAPNDIALDEKNVVQPDLFFISKDNIRCKRGDDYRWKGAPDLCVEVLSPSTAKFDRKKKFELYARYGVQEYWIIDPVNRLVEVFVAQNGSFQRHAVYDDQDSFTSLVIPQLTIIVADIFYKE